MSFPAKLDILTATATSLQSQLTDGTLTSVEIVEAYLDQIAAHNRQGLGLRAIASVAPREIAFKRARQLDSERGDGKVRGPLHGIPIIVKDAIVTAPELGMPTTAGAVAFETAIAKKSATLVEQLLAAGMILLGKASMTEFCGHRAGGIAAGYSAHNGQTQSAYIRGGRRADDGVAGHTGSGGSSSGSAVGVAAGFSPVSIATETAGSLVLPANRSALYAVRLTRGSAPADGMFRLASGWDTVGPMAKCPEDLAAILEALMGEEARGMLHEGGLKGVMDGKMGGLRLGFVDFEEWQPMSGWGSTAEEMEQMREEYRLAMEKMKGLGWNVTYPVEVPFKDGVSEDGEGVKKVSDGEVQELFKEFTACFESTPVRTWDDLIAWNEANAERAMPEPHPDQKELFVVKENTMTRDETAELATKLQKKARAGLDSVFKDIDLIISPSDTKLASNIAAAGYAAGVVPLGYLESCGMPQGLTITARAHEEAKVLQFMSAFEAAFPARKAPPLLQ